ncbi:MAG: hypothetical protein CL886_01335 [Dehalococcoidia bacterium]|nr:hypothetical protein [Dehalococcoidia bacterium]
MNLDTYGILTAFYGVLIPSNGTMPSGSEIIAESDLHQLLEMTHKYAESIENVCEFISKESVSISKEGASNITDQNRVAILRSMESTMPSDFDMFLEATYLLYYSKPIIHQLIKWNTDEDADKNQLKPFDSSILDNISKREPFWREI